MRYRTEITGGGPLLHLWHHDFAYPLCLLGAHAWLFDANDHSQRTCTRLRCSYGKVRLGCWHFWREWNDRRFQLYTNACRPCRARAARRWARP